MSLVYNKVGVCEDRDIGIGWRFYYWHGWMIAKWHVDVIDLYPDH